jgi:hypothetical protein
MPRALSGAALLATLANVATTAAKIADRETFM